MTHDIQSRADIELLVRTFYTAVVADPTIGHIFTRVAAVDWDAHLPVMYSFWESLLLQTHSYAGNPMQTHKALSQKTSLEERHFEAWEALWISTVDELFAGPVAQEAKQRAIAIASVMLQKVQPSGTMLPIAGI